MVRHTLRIVIGIILMALLQIGNVNAYFGGNESVVFLFDTGYGINCVQVVLNSNSNSFTTGCGGGQRVWLSVGDTFSFYAYPNNNNYVFERFIDDSGNTIIDNPYTGTITRSATYHVIFRPLSPKTTVELFGTLGNNNWYSSEVLVKLVAVDDELGSGIAKTEYSLDNGASWIQYSVPFTISNGGTTTIQYKSTDNAGNVEPIKTQDIKIYRTATVDVKPDTLNKASQNDENTIRAYIEIPGYDINLIDLSTVILSTTNGMVSAQLSPTIVGDYDSDGIPDRMVKFDRRSVIGIVDIGNVEVTVSGKIAGEEFEGSDEVIVINPHQTKP